MKVVYAPGCFDGFEGTQEELDALKAEIEAKLADGTLFDGARPVTPEEAEELGLHLPPETRQ